jgi:hypothetical protein
VERVVGDRRELAVRLDHEGDVGRLDRDLDVVEADLGEEGQLVLRRLDEGLGGGPAVLLVEAGVERAGVDPDADGHAPVLALPGDQLDLLGLAEVARVEPEAVDAGLEGGEGHLDVEVDVGDDRDGAARHDLGEALGRFLLVARAADDVGAGALQGVDLRQRAFDVGGLGDCHRLDRDPGVTADGHLADHQLPGNPARVGAVGRCHRLSDYRHPGGLDPRRCARSRAVR